MYCIYIKLVLFFLLQKIYEIEFVTINHFYAYHLSQDTIIMRTQIQNSASLRALPTDICPCHRKNTLLFMFTALKNAQHPTAQGRRFIIKSFISVYECTCKSFNRLALSTNLKATDVSNNKI